MKTPHDPRHIKRKKAIKALFATSFNKHQPPQAGLLPTKNKLALKIIKNLKKIDKVIAKNAPEWPIEQINRVDLAILRLAVFELAIAPQEPAKVIIDEAVELGKKYGSDNTPSFVNGVLGAILKKEKNEHPTN